MSSLSSLSGVVRYYGPVSVLAMPGRSWTLMKRLPLSTALLVFSPLLWTVGNAVLGSVYLLIQQGLTGSPFFIVAWLGFCLVAGGFNLVSLMFSWICVVAVVRVYHQGLSHPADILPLSSQSQEVSQNDGEDGDIKNVKLEEPSESSGSGSVKTLSPSQVSASNVKTEQALLKETFKTALADGFQVAAYGLSMVGFNLFMLFPYLMLFALSSTGISLLMLGASQIHEPWIWVAGVIVAVALGLFMILSGWVTLVLHGVGLLMPLVFVGVSGPWKTWGDKHKGLIPPGKEEEAVSVFPWLLRSLQLALSDLFSGYLSKMVRLFALQIYNFPRMLGLGSLLLMMYGVMALVLHFPVYGYLALENNQLALHPERLFSSGLPTHARVILQVWSGLVFALLNAFLYVNLTQFLYDCQVRSEGLDLSLALDWLVSNRDAKRREGKNIPRAKPKGSLVKRIAPVKSL
ncbi:MAG: hypothetical protein K2X66_12895 [Cyanobacteria bacterium]|nr:hypothetical protein [Cyanobacteriota bacterium]